MIRVFGCGGLLSRSLGSVWADAFKGHIRLDGFLSAGLQDVPLGPLPRARGVQGGLWPFGYVSAVFHETGWFCLFYLC